MRHPRPPERLDCAVAVEVCAPALAASLLPHAVSASVRPPAPTPAIIALRL